MSNKVRGFRLSDQTSEKIDKLVSIQNEFLKEIKQPLQYSRSDIVMMAIDYYIEKEYGDKFAD